MAFQTVAYTSTVLAAMEIHTVSRSPEPPRYLRAMVEYYVSSCHWFTKGVAVNASWAISLENQEESLPNQEVSMSDPMHWVCTKLGHMQRGRSDDQLFIQGTSPTSGLTPLIVVLSMRKLSSLRSPPDPLRFPRLRSHPPYPVDRRPTRSTLKLCDW